MIRKRLLTLTLISAICFSITGCGSDKSEANKETESVYIKETDTTIETETKTEELVDVKGYWIHKEYGLGYSFVDDKAVFVIGDEIIESSYEIKGNTLILNAGEETEENIEIQIKDNELIFLGDEDNDSIIFSPATKEEFDILIEEAVAQAVSNK